MGQELNFACKDCKKVYYIGYGSPKMKECESYKSCMEEHGTHNWADLHPEYLRMRGKDLVTDHPYKNESEDEIVIENYADFEMIGFAQSAPDSTE